MARFSLRKLSTFVISCCVTLLLLTRSWTQTGDPGDRGDPGDPGDRGGLAADRCRPRCSRVFSLSDSRQFWESAAEAAGACRSSALDSTSLPGILERRRADTGRRALLLFVGDSRVRILFERLREELALQWEGRRIEDVFPVELSLPNVTAKVHGEPELCVAGHTVGFFPEDNTLRLACDEAASNRLVRAQFFWHPHVDADYLSRLSGLTAACERGADCPDLVVLTAGMWYAKTFETYAARVPLPRRVLQMRRDAATLADRLRPLAAHSQLLYRLDGPEMTEPHGYKSRIGGVIAAINALAFGIIKQVGGTAQVWTSNLADSLRFYHTACLPMTRRRDAASPMVHQCMDPNHVGSAVRRNAVHMLLSFVCGDCQPRRPGDCCGAAVTVSGR